MACLELKSKNTKAHGCTIVQEPPAKRSKIQPPPVSSDVRVIKSTSGGATVETVETIFRSSASAGLTNGDFYELGFGWCTTDKVLLRLHIDAGATTTVADLLAIDAVRASYKSGECVLSKRTDLKGFVFSALNEVCTEAGFTHRKGVGWIKAMGDTEWRALVADEDDEGEEVSVLSTDEEGSVLSKEEQIARIKESMPTDKDGKKTLTRDGAVQVIEVLAPGRFKVDAFGSFWSCCLVDNRWSTASDRYERTIFDMREHLEEWVDRPDKLKTYFMRDRAYYDPTLHEKMDKTLSYVSFTGTINVP